MVKLDVTSEHRLTLPVDIAHAAGITPGSLCQMEVSDGVIKITSVESGPKRPLADYAGIATGAWGSSEDEIQATIDADRKSWER